MGPHQGKPLATAEPFVPESDDLDLLAAAVQECQGCDLYLRATQAVFGTGDQSAQVMFVGEQPGDAEDRAGRPAVRGPGRSHVQPVLELARIDRSAAYVTNAVKHFRWKSTDNGPRRIHQNPTTRHIVACAPWLTAELATVRPRVVVALGATAGKSLFGSQLTVSAHRGTVLHWPPDRRPFAGNKLPMAGALLTIHPPPSCGPAERRSAATPRKEWWTTCPSCGNY